MDVHLITNSKDVFVLPFLSFSTNFFVYILFSVEII